MGGSCCCLAYVVGKNDIRDPLATKRSLLWAFGLLLTFIRHFKTGDCRFTFATENISFFKRKGDKFVAIQKQKCI